MSVSSLYDLAQLGPAMELLSFDDPAPAPADDAPANPAPADDADAPLPNCLDLAAQIAASPEAAAYAQSIGFDPNNVTEDDINDLLAQLGDDGLAQIQAQLAQICQ